RWTQHRAHNSGRTGRTIANTNLPTMQQQGWFGTGFASCKHDSRPGLGGSRRLGPEGKCERWRCGTANEDFDGKGSESINYSDSRGQAGDYREVQRNDAWFW